MRFVETRGNDGSHAESVSFSDAILSPLASFGGIYSPETLPRLDQDFLESQLSASYKSLALSLIALLGIDIDSHTLQQAVDLYDRFDNSDHPVPVVRLHDNLYISEL